MSQHMVTDSAWPKDKDCDHNDTRIIGYCKSKKKNCPVSDCIVLDDDMPECKELILIKICNNCEEELGEVE